MEIAIYSIDEISAPHASLQVGFKWTAFCASLFFKSLLTPSMASLAIAIDFAACSDDLAL